MSEDEQRIQYSGGINESSALKQSNGMNGHCIRTKSLFVNESQRGKLINILERIMWSESSYLSGMNQFWRVNHFFIETYLK